MNYEGYRIELGSWNSKTKQLRSQHSRNGLIENKLSNVSNENYIVQADANYQMDDQDILSINSEDFLDEERWLYAPPNSIAGHVSANPTNLQKWLRQDVDNNNDVEFQLIKTKLIHELDEIEQGLRRNNIDTRTFTRSKKRMSRPSLETMVESSPLHHNRRRILSPWRTAQCRNDDLDDYHFSVNSPLSLLSDSTLLNANFSAHDSAELNALFQKIASEPQLNLSSRNKTFQKTASDPDNMHITYQKFPEPELNATFLKSSEPCLTSVQKPVDLNATFQISPKSRSITPSGLNCTFQIQDGSSSGSNRSGRAMSFDSGGDDDQHSSASDSSFSSSNRLMNVGDVQNIARLQEESLKQVMSTPKNQKRDGLIPSHEDDLPSPILRDYNHGYQSDHSDHSSSADGRARSSRSSLKSSPGSSPFGSTQILSNVPESVPCNPVVGLPRRELKLIPAGKQEVPKPQMAVKPTDTVQANRGRGRGMSGLRPPTVRSQGGNSGLPRAQSQGRVSSIPRPASRIPPPRIRTSYSSQSTNKVNWMDDCY